jgi:hypothetical protein
MKTKAISTIFATFALVFTAAMVAAAQDGQSGQTKQPQAGSVDMGTMTQEPAKGETMTDAQMMARCQEMMDQKQKMKADMKAQDAQLTEQIAKMNRAEKDKKMDLMAAVLTNMEEQRIAMDARKAKMEEEMMKHMMQHMQMGKESMSQCPMMKGM